MIPTIYGVNSVFDFLGDLNWVGILVGFAASTVVGRRCLVRGAFPQGVHRSLSRDADAKPEGSALFYAGPAFTALVVTVTSAILTAALNVDSYADAPTTSSAA